MNENIKIRSDLSSCDHISLTTLQVSLPNPMASLVVEVPLLDEIPLYTSKAEAGVMSLKEVKQQLANRPKKHKDKHIIDIARPYASEMKLLKPALTKEIIQFVLFRISVMLTNNCVHCFTALHLFFM